MAIHAGALASGATAAVERPPARATPAAKLWFPACGPNKKTPNEITGLARMEPGGQIEKSSSLDQAQHVWHGIRNYAPDWYRPTEPGCSVRLVAATNRPASLAMPCHAWDDGRAKGTHRPRASRRSFLTAMTDWGWRSATGIHHSCLRTAGRGRASWPARTGGCRRASSRPPARRRCAQGHNYLGHNYMGHNYIGPT